LDIDRLLLSRMIDGGLMHKAQDEHLEAALFEGKGRQVWEFCERHYREFGSAPGRVAVESAFPEYVMPCEESFSWLLQEIRTRFVYNESAASVREAAKLLQEGKDPRGALELFKRAVRRSESMATRSRDVDWTKSARRRKEAYLEAKAAKGLTGLPFPFPSLNATTMGIQPDDFVVVAARQGIGKTWFEVVLAHYLWTQGFKPLLFTREMSVDRIMKRLDAVYAKVGYQELRAGRLDSLVEIEFFKKLDELEDKHSLTVIQGTGGVTEILAKTERYRPDVVLVDGLYLVRDDQGAHSSWEQLKNVARDFKEGICLNLMVPVVASTQFSKEATNTQGEARNIAYGDIAKETDVIIGMFQSRDQELANLMRLELLKQREGPNLDMEVVWNLDTMEFAELGGADSSVQDTEELAF